MLSNFLFEVCLLVQTDQLLDLSYQILPVLRSVSAVSLPMVQFLLGVTAISNPVDRIAVVVHPLLDFFR